MITRRGTLLALATTAVLICAVPQAASANIFLRYGLCNPSDGCDQSLGFSNETGTSVTGNTNPPAPLYDITVSSNEGLTLHGSGSVVDTGVGGPGFTDITITPQAGYAWGAFEFQLNSTLHTRTDLGGLDIYATDLSGTVFSFLNLTFPWEGNNGQNQHYTLYTDGLQVITSVRIDYNDPLCTDPPPTGGCNRIGDIHNIDFNTVLIPEPGSLALLGLGLAGLAAVRRRKQ